MLEYRVTKYDPAYRDERGAYKRSDWTSISDIGNVFGGSVLTAVEYHRVENAYSTAAVAFMREAGVQSLTIVGLENHGAAPLPYCENSALGLSEVSGVIRQLLRETFWCRLEGVEAFVHVGRDFYMYIGVSKECVAAASKAQHLGLFVEPFRSPYRQILE